MSLKLIDNSSIGYTTHFTFHISLFLQGLLKVQTGEVVTVYDEGHPRGLWRLGRVGGVQRRTNQDHSEANSTHLPIGSEV